MSPKRFAALHAGCFLLILTILGSVDAVEPGDVIINEVYFNNVSKDLGTNHFDAVELLVVADKSDLNGLMISDRDKWNVRGEFAGILQDAGQGFLRSVRSGTLLVIYDGTGEDDTDATDFTLALYTDSSLFCNLAGQTNMFLIGNPGDNLHVLHNEQQVDFVKYRPNDKPEHGGDPGRLGWDKGFNGFIDVGLVNENAGFRFLGDKADLNDYPAAWQPYPESYYQTNNLGQPNGGRNTVWIESLRRQGAVTSEISPALRTK